MLAKDSSYGGARINDRALSLVNWEHVCVPKQFGGLGLRECGMRNKALLAKQLWSIANKEDSLWVRWIHGWYLKDRNIWDVPLSSTASWHWCKLVRLRDKLQPAVVNGDWVQAGMADTLLAKVMSG